MTNIILTIQFCEKTHSNVTSQLELNDAVYIPNLGEKVHNQEDGTNTYVVVSKTAFLSEVMTHIVMYCLKQ